MKKILVPCNFSASCEKAILFAAELADQTDGEVIVLTVIQDTDKIEPASKRIMDAASREAGLKFEKLTKSISVSVCFRHLIMKGKLLPAVLKCIAREKIDIVVMGTRGSRGWDQFFMGSNIEKVIRTSPVPVFAVKGSTLINSIKNIVAPLSLETCPTRFISQLNLLQRFFKARFHFIYVAPDEMSASAGTRHLLETYVKQLGVKNYTLNAVAGKDVKDSIIHFAREINADMIAMRIHRVKDFKHLYTSSVPADVVNHSNILTWTYGISRKPVRSKSFTRQLAEV